MAFVWLGHNDDARPAVESLTRIEEEDCLHGCWEEDEV